MAGTPEPAPDAAALPARLGMTLEQVMEMNRRRAGQLHAAGARAVSGPDGGIAAARPHGLPPAPAAFLVQGGGSTAAALASATALAAAACGPGDKKGRPRGPAGLTTETPHTRHARRRRNRRA
jgi:imidazolonepropionase-like amidohydrolase